MSDEARHGTNSHILVQRFDYMRPATLRDAVALLVEHGERARVLAGGTNLLVDMKLERVAPRVVIDLAGVPGLAGIQEEAGMIRIGALTPIRALATSALLWEKATALAEAAAAFGSTQIAIRGTIGGNVCNGSPASDTVPALLALEAEAVLAGRDGERTTAVGDLLKEPGRTRVRPDEILRELRVPVAGSQTASAFLKLSRVRADLSKVSVAVRLVRDGAAIRTVRIELGSVGPTVLRARKTESALSGKAFSENAVLEAAGRVSEDIQPIDDVRSTADYRRRAAVALVHDAIVAAWSQFETAPRRPRGRTAATSRPIESMHVAADEVIPIRITVNGERRELDVAANELLLHVLRERLELTGAKYGCGIGECGACTVWLDGLPVLGCLVLAVSADGGDVRTVEGLAAPDGTLDPLQEAFIEENAFQCGYCTPGMLMMTKKLLEEIPEPTEDEVRDYLKGNRCRCTGYASIVRAVLRASRAERHAPPGREADR
jgi:xanthine dehydrogenase iron-sulfur cluster and FAD-binding subunit A